MSVCGNWLQHRPIIITEIVVADLLVVSVRVKGVIEFAPGDPPRWLDHLEMIEVEPGVEGGIGWRNPMVM